ncbi:30S ribosomal protein S9 [candidate division WWE3 bacterium]|nr:30S ribosomal protein S9 [candidate division WWE3 bacterium]
MVDSKAKKPAQKKIISRTPKISKKDDKAKESKDVKVIKTDKEIKVKNAKINPIEEIVIDTTQKKQSKFKKPLASGTGRRKTGVASVFLNEGKGEFIVNGKEISVYFPSVKDQVIWMLPFHTVGISHPDSKYNATIKIVGSGKQGQLQALVHGFARALSKLSEENSIILRKAGLMTRDSRMVERKKPFLRKARKQPQYSKR